MAGPVVRPVNVIILTYWQAAARQLTFLDSGVARGDWNGNTEFDSSDVILAFQEGGFEQGRRANLQAVPEPTSTRNLLLGLALTWPGMRDWVRRLVLQRRAI